jgi:hypothetical protein
MVNRIMAGDLELKETVATKLARIEERIANFVENNNSKHDEIIDKLDKLCSHVNHENELMDIRIRTLENKHISDEAVKSKLDVLKDNKWTIIIASIFTGIITLIVKLAELGLI